MNGTQLTIFDVLAPEENQRLLGRNWRKCVYRHAILDPYGEPWPFQAELSFAQVKAIANGGPA